MLNAALVTDDLDAQYAFHSGHADRSLVWTDNQHMHISPVDCIAERKKK